METQPESAPSRAIGVRVGRFTLTGGAATAFLSIVLVAIIAGVVISRPSLSNWPTWVSAALWLVFLAYWSKAAASAANSTGGESAASRRTHVRMLNLGLLLLFLPLPGL